jgi:hypothetical protein
MRRGTIEGNRAPRRGLKGFCLTAHLREQGVTCSRAMYVYMQEAYRNLQADPSYDITRIRVSPSNPNMLPN